MRFHHQVKNKIYYIIKKTHSIQNLTLLYHIFTEKKSLITKALLTFGSIISVVGKITIEDYRELFECRQKVP